MAPAPQDMSSPGTATYDSDTLSVGDGTWDFSKNNFLLPPLVGVPFDTMRYNGMGNRFSSLTQYHQIVLAHAILGALVFLLLVPVSVFAARFYDTGRRLHARLNIFAGLMLLAAFILGYFAVGPERSLTNPHHGIGVAIFLIFILQMFGGWLVSGIRKYHSFRITLHQWSGRVLATLGIIQVPLGLTLYGSPLYTFVLFTVWMSFLLLVYFIMDYRRQGRDGGHRHGGRSDYTATNVTTDDGGGKKKWLAPLLAGAGVMALLNMRKKKRERSLSRSPSRSRRSRSYSRSRMDSRSRVGGMSAAPTSYYDGEKHDDHDRKTGGGWMSKVLPMGAAFGAWKLATRGKKREVDPEYSSVANDTPSRPPRRGAYTTSDLSEISDQYRPDPRRDPRGPPRMSAHAMSAVESGPPGRRSHGGPPRPMDSQAYSGLSYDDGSYDSPSRRPTDGGGHGGGAAKGLLAGLGMGWLASKFGGGKKKTAPRYDDDRYTYDDEQSRLSGSRYTAYTSPPRAGRRDSPRLSRGGRRPSVSHAPTEDSSVLEPRYGGGGPPMPPLSHGAPPPPGGAAPPPAAGPGGMAPPYASRHDVIEPVDMPAMPPDRHGDLPRDSRTSVNRSPSDRLQRRDSSRRRKAGAEAAAAAAASASALAAEEESRHGGGGRGDRRASRDRSDRDRTPTRPPRTTIKMTVHDDRVNLRRLTDEEASKTRRSRRGGDSASTLSDDQDTPPRRYRRDASRRRAESSAAAEAPPDSPLSPPNPAFASGRGRAKDSAYYSGQPGGAVPVTPQQQGLPISSVGSGSHGTWSEAVSPSPQDKLAGSAADNRRRRRQERRRSVSGRPAGADMFD